MPIACLIEQLPQPFWRVLGTVIGKVVLPECFRDLRFGALRRAHDRFLVNVVDAHHIALAAGHICYFTFHDLLGCHPGGFDNLVALDDNIRLKPAPECAAGYRLAGINDLPFLWCASIGTPTCDFGLPREFNIVSGGTCYVLRPCF